MWGMKIPPFFWWSMDEQGIPRHIAIIMDGNGRWANRRGLERLKGHMEGLHRVSEIAAAAADLGVEFLTLYTFSKENWKRPQSEVSMLMQLISMALEQKTQELLDRNIRFNFIGQQAGIPEHILKSLKRTRETTRTCTGLQVNLAFNYGSRSEILDGVKSVALDVQNGRLAVEQVTEELFSQRLYTQGMPDPDLLIRTSGEKRISNFLLWQISYAELYFSDVFWPDFTVEEFHKAIDDYRGRERRFGGVTASTKIKGER